MKITNDLIYIGVNDHQIDLFEGQYKVENGMAYNSYLLLDEKVAVFDTVDKNFKTEWLQNLKTALNGSATKLRTSEYRVSLTLSFFLSLRISRYSLDLSLKILW